MLSLLLFQAAAQAAPAPPAPADWSMLAPIAYATAPQLTPAMNQFVAGEIAAGRCRQTKAADGHWTIRLDVAMLVAADGTVRRAVPRAIDCPTVEQYGAGLVTGFARGNLQQRANGAQWMRATIVFDGK